MWQHVGGSDMDVEVGVMESDVQWVFTLQNCKHAGP